MEENGSGRFERIEKHIETLYDLVNKNTHTTEWILQHAKETDDRIAAGFERTQQQLDRLGVRMTELGDRVDSLVVAIGKYIAAREQK